MLSSYRSVGGYPEKLQSYPKDIEKYGRWTDVKLSSTPPLLGPRGPPSPLLMQAQPGGDCEDPGPDPSASYSRAEGSTGRAAAQDRERLLHTGSPSLPRTVIEACGSLGNSTPCLLGSESLNL